MCNKLKNLEGFNTLLEVSDYFKDEITCLKYLEQWLWNGDMHCPYCGMNEKIYRYKDEKRFKCKQCMIVFSAKVGTIFENSKLPMRIWFMAIHLISSYKKGISSCQLARELGITQKTAWFMAHRIRKIFEQIPTEKLEGVIEVDETFVGGKNKNRHIDKKVKNPAGRGFLDKTPVIGMLKRGGEVRTKVIDNTKTSSLRPAVMNHIKEGSIVYTDDWHGYDLLPESYNRKSIDHSRGRYRDGDVCTNGIESFWSHLKRMIIGVYHKVSKKHLQRYCDEITFRFNTKHLKQSDRLKLLLSKVNCRITYHSLTYNHG